MERNQIGTYDWVRKPVSRPAVGGCRFSRRKDRTLLFLGGYSVVLTLLVVGCLLDNYVTRQHATAQAALTREYMARADKAILDSTQRKIVSLQSQNLEDITALYSGMQANTELVANTREALNSRLQLKALAR